MPNIAGPINLNLTVPNTGGVLSPNNYGTPAGFNGVPGVALPGQSADLNNIINQQTQNAQNFTQSMPGLANQLYGQAYNQSRQGLAKSMRDVNASYNSRGLLNSGKRQSAQYGAQADATNNLNRTAQGINSQLLNEQQQLYSAPLASAVYAAQAPYLGASAAAPLANDLAAQMANQEGNMTIFGGLMNAFGNVAGGQIAGAKSNAPATGTV